MLVESAAVTEAESVEAAVGTVAPEGTVAVARLCVARECVDLRLVLYFLSLFSLWMSSGILGMLRFFRFAGVHQGYGRLRINLW